MPSNSAMPGTFAKDALDFRLETLTRGVGKSAIKGFAPSMGRGDYLHGCFSPRRASFKQANRAHSCALCRGEGAMNGTVFSPRPLPLLESES